MQNHDDYNLFFGLILLTLCKTRATPMRSSSWRILQFEQLSFWLSYFGRESKYPKPTTAASPPRTATCVLVAELLEFRRHFDQWRNAGGEKKEIARQRENKLSGLVAGLGSRGWYQIILIGCCWIPCEKLTFFKTVTLYLTLLFHPSTRLRTHDLRTSHCMMAKNLVEGPF